MILLPRFICHLKLTAKMQTMLPISVHRSKLHISLAGDTVTQRFDSRPRVTLCVEFPHLLSCPFESGDYGLGGIVLSAGLMAKWPPSALSELYDSRILNG